MAVQRTAAWSPLFTGSNTSAFSSPASLLLFLAAPYPPSRKVASIELEVATSKVSARRPYLSFVIDCIFERRWVALFGRRHVSVGLRRNNFS